jgi:surface antigen
VKKIRCIVLAAGLLTAVVFAACEAPTENRKEVAGTVIGAVIGGVVGSQIGHGGGRTAAAVVGTVAGGVIGHSIGKNMDATDHLKACQALENSRTGEATTWRNPDSGTTYTVVPTRTYQAAQGPCREYTMDAKVGEKTEQVHGTACRQSDGSWQAQS